MMNEEFEGFCERCMQDRVFDSLERCEKCGLIFSEGLDSEEHLERYKILMDKYKKLEEIIHEYNMEVDLLTETEHEDL